MESVDFGADAGWDSIENVNSWICQPRFDYEINCTCGVALFHIRGYEEVVEARVGRRR